MKKLSLVIHSNQQQELADLLRSFQLACFMFSHIEEHSSQDKHDVFLSARDRVVGYIPKVRLDVILDDTRAVTLLEEIRQSTFPCDGKNMYWITDLDESGQL